MHYNDLFWYHDLFKAKYNSFIYDVALEGIKNARTLKEATLLILSFLIDYNKVWYTFNEDGKQAFENLSSHAKSLYCVLKRVEGFLKTFQNLALEDADLKDERLVKAVDVVFNEVTKVCGRTGASKVLHLLAPSFFVMWDEKIRDFYNVASYIDFLRRMKDELNEALTLYCQDFKVDRNRAKEDIKARCGGKPLTKIIDEYNFLKITVGVGTKVDEKIRRIMTIIREIVDGAMEVAEEPWAKKSGYAGMLRSSAAKLLRVMEDYALKGDLEGLMKYYEAALRDQEGRIIDRILVSRGKKSLKTEYERVKKIVENCH